MSNTLEKLLLAEQPVFCFVLPVGGSRPEEVLLSVPTRDTVDSLERPAQHRIRQPRCPCEKKRRPEERLRGYSGPAKLMCPLHIQPLLRSCEEEVK